MGKLIVTEFVSLDGVAQAPGGPDEDPEGGFTQGGWQAPLRHEKTAAVIYDGAKTMDALLLGRKTYDIFARYWPSAPQEIPFSGLLNNIPKYVASRTLSAPLGWRGSTLLADPITESIVALKECHDEVHVIGSLNLVQTLLRNRLVDRLSLWVHPLVLGGGKKVFEDGAAPTALKLVDSTAYPKGTLHLTYETTGEPTYGDMTKI